MTSGALWPGQRIEAVRERATTRWTLTTDGEELGQVVLEGGVPELHLEGRPWSIAPSGGWRFAIVDGRGAPIAWFTGRSLTGRVVVAPDREYRLRWMLPVWFGWRLLEGRTTVITARKRRRRRHERLEATIAAAPRVLDDALALAIVTIVVALLYLSQPAVDGGG
jgi:hypothetical protein